MQTAGPQADSRKQEAHAGRQPKSATQRRHEQENGHHQSETNQQGQMHDRFLRGVNHGCVHVGMENFPSMENGAGCVKSAPTHQGPCEPVVRLRRPEARYKFAARSTAQRLHWRSPDKECPYQHRDHDRGDAHDHEPPGVNWPGTFFLRVFTRLLQFLFMVPLMPMLLVMLIFVIQLCLLRDSALLRNFGAARNQTSRIPRRHFVRRAIGRMENRLDRRHGKQPHGGRERHIYIAAISLAKNSIERLNRASSLNAVCSNPARARARLRFRRSSRGVTTVVNDDVDEPGHEASRIDGSAPSDGCVRGAGPGGARPEPATVPVRERRRVRAGRNRRQHPRPVRGRAARPGSASGAVAATGPGGAGPESVQRHRWQGRRAAGVEFRRGGGTAAPARRREPAAVTAAGAGGGARPASATVA